MTTTAKKCCEVCGARVPELRRNRCWGCYTRWQETRPVGLGASCILCSDRRRDSLKMIELLGSWAPACFTCASRAGRLSPMPQTLDGIRQALDRNRRRDDRRASRPDPRTAARERRGLERRNVGHGDQGDLLILDEDDLILIDLDAQIGAPDRGEETRILALPVRDGA